MEKMLLMNDALVAQRVFDHIANGTTDMGDQVWREPVANYRQQERLDREIEQVLRRFATPFCPSVALADAGSYVARRAAGTPLVAVRGRDGVVHAFRNVCRHRGMEVAAGSGCAKVFVCGYHGWAYGLDGRLQHVPHEHGFPGLEKDQHALVPVSTVERHGLVFVNQHGPIDESALEEFPPLLADGQRLGGIVQGLGQAWCEEVRYDENGQLLTATLMDYALPRAAMFPRFELDMTCTPSPLNPLGAKGIGELGTIGATPCLVSAALDALAPLGVTQLDMPLKSERLWRAIRDAAAGGTR